MACYWSSNRPRDHPGLQIEGTRWRTNLLEALQEASQKWSIFINAVGRKVMFSDVSVCPQGESLSYNVKAAKELSLSGKNQAGGTVMGKVFFFLLFCHSIISHLLFEAVMGLKPVRLVCR